MSWSRILRFARERQVPVIVTDETGEDPMILLSLDQLEEALGGATEPSPSPAPTPSRPPTPSFVPEAPSSLPQGGGEFHLEEEQLPIKDGYSQDEVRAEDVLAVSEVPTPEPEEETTNLTLSDDTRFTTQEEVAPGKERGEASEGYGEIVVAPQIEVSPLIRGEQELSADPVPTPAEEVQASDDQAPAVIWEEGDLPMPQGNEEEGGADAPAADPVVQEPPAAVPATTRERTIGPDVSLEERFFLDF